MENRERPVVVSTRLSRRERGLVALVAQAENVTVCKVLHELLIPALRARVAELLTEEVGR